MKTRPKTTSDLLTAQEAADRLDCSVRTLLRRIAKGQIVGKKHGAKLMVPEASIEHYFSNLPDARKGRR